MDTPSRRTVSRMRCPGVTAPNLRAPSGARIDAPSTCVMRSPERRPATSAGPPAATMPISGGVDDSQFGVASVPSRAQPHSLQRIENPNQPAGDAGLGGTGGSGAYGGVDAAG